MPFGLQNSGQTFQRHMHQVLAHLEFCIPYFDDLLIASSSEDENLDNLHQIFSRLRDYGLKVKGLKSSLTAPYQGPFEVLSRTDKHFTIKINDRTSTISIDRLKPAFLLNDTDSAKEPFPVQKSNHPIVLPPRFDQNVPIPATTRSGRRVRFNPKYS
ncbi:retrovirus-related Pol polyprotein from transposon opus [Trichonephila clavata]|uniref:Retrovirus-related Pol polyprotein from transposon opus n=1 Tax=Trichonephila clavata TaxID=2740835 RepID=A0A8X6GG78_TRICU|nr:retrovirus-related Pol polyprotein from transposon opus [Trichonephila clavata]